MSYVRQKRSPRYTPTTNPHVWDGRYGPHPRRQPARAVYYQLVESYREGGKVRQRVLLHLGEHPTVDEYLAYLEKWRGFALQHAEDYRHPRRLHFGEVVGPDPLLEAKMMRKAAEYTGRIQKVLELRAEGRA